MAEERDNYSNQMRKGVLEYIICLYLLKKDYYAGELIEEIKGTGLMVVEGTMYPLLSRMLKSGYLEYKWEEASSGHPRKYYSLTLEGKNLAKHMETIWKDISGAVKKAQK